MAIVLVAALAVVAGLTSVSGAPAGAAASRDRISWTRGTPVTGARGVLESVVSIQARQRAADAAGIRQHAPLPPMLDPSRRLLRQDPSAPAVSRWPAPGGSRSADSTDVRSRAPQTPDTSFTGATLGSSHIFPPDSMGAIGPNQFIVAVNNRIRSFHKNGNPDGALNVTPDTFFHSVMTPPVSSNFTSDPHIRYDRLSGRWFIVMIDVPGGQGKKRNRIMIAVSKGATITSSSSFRFFFFQSAATNKFADYPTLGIDEKALYIGVNSFSTSSGSFVNTDAFVVRKSSILGTGPIVRTTFPNLINPSTHVGPFTPQGVDDLDTGATQGYFIGVDNAFFGRLDLRRVLHPGGTPSISSNIQVSGVPKTFFHFSNPGVRQKGTTAKLDDIDDRLFAATVRDGHLWTAHNITVNSNGVAATNGDRDGSRWYEIKNVAAGTPSLVQSGTVFDPSTKKLSFWMPTIMVSGQEHAALGFSRSGPGFHPNAGTVGRLVGDPHGSTRAPVMLTNGTAVYNPFDGTGSRPRRWGDFSFTSLDPRDDMTMWTVQEFVNQSNSWGVRVVELVAPPPATPSSANPASVPSGQSSVSVTITGTSVAGSGFYDPGPDLGGSALPFDHIQAAVSGGVVVNSVTFDSPTSVTLDLDTTAATAGDQDVTITNPDGQARTGTGILTVEP